MRRQTTPKTRSARADVNRYLAAVGEPARGTLQKLRATIRAAAPKEATEVLSYRIPTFKYKGGLVAFAAFSGHCSFFPMSRAVMEQFREELQGFPTSKGTIRFPVDKPLPATLVTKIVRARIAENRNREQRRAAQSGGR